MKYNKLFKKIKRKNPNAQVRVMPNLSLNEEELFRYFQSYSDFKKYDETYFIMELNENDFTVHSIFNKDGMKTEYSYKIIGNG